MYILGNKEVAKSRLSKTDKKSSIKAINIRGNIRKGVAKQISSGANSLYSSVDKFKAQENQALGTSLPSDVFDPVEVSKLTFADVHPVLKNKLLSIYILYTIKLDKTIFLLSLICHGFLVIEGRSEDS